MNKIWDKCFLLGLESLKNGSIPIGSVVVDENNHFIGSGRNLTKDSNSKGLINNHKLAHAEINALLSFNSDHPNVRKYTIYTTMEPCPLCFGAIIMANIRNIKYAARDGWAGSTNLKNEYIISKNMNIEGPFKELEELQIALNSYFELSYYKKESNIYDAFSKYCIKGVKLGKYLYENNILEPLFKINEDNIRILDIIKGYLNKI